MAAPSIAGKIALVTGASRGIGRAIAQRLAAAGATVVVTARSLDRPVQTDGSQVMQGTLSETVGLIEKAGGRAIPLGADLENQAERAALVGRAAEAAGGLDILVNNAGYAHFAPVETMPLSVFDLTIEHYFRTPFVLSQAAIPFMRQRGAGWIVNIGSVAAFAPPRPYKYAGNGGHVYGAVKAALSRFTQGLAAELLESNIAVNLVGPSGAIHTPGADRFIPASFKAEPVEYLAETVLALSHLPAAQRTGLVTYAMHFPTAMNIDVYSLDGKSRLPPQEPTMGHPSIKPNGEYP